MQLIEALQTIKDTCKSAKCCEKCPLRSYDDCCYLANAPQDWEFAGEDIPPRVFA